MNSSRKYIERRLFLSKTFEEDKDIIKAEKVFLNETEYLIRDKIDGQTVVYRNKMGNYFMEEDTHYNTFHVHNSIWNKISNVGFSREESRMILKHCIKKYINNKVTTIYTTVALEFNNKEKWEH